MADLPEKATAIHVFCLQGCCRGAERFARHWYDVAQPEETDLATRIIADIEVARAVASHRALFFSEQDASGRGIDYAATVAGGLRLVPEGAARELRDNDYQRMAQDGLLLDGAESFHVLMSRCWCIGLEANETTSRRHT